MIILINLSAYLEIQNYLSNTSSQLLGCVDKQSPPLIFSGLNPTILTDAAITAPWTEPSDTIHGRVSQSLSPQSLSPSVSQSLSLTVSQSLSPQSLSLSVSQSSVSQSLSLPVSQSLSPQSSVLSLSVSQSSVLSMGPAATKALCEDKEPKSVYF